MTGNTFTDEQVMAFADGEADGVTAAAIAAAAKADPQLAQRIDRFLESRRLVKMAMPLEPVPMDLEAKIRAMALKSQADTGPAGSAAQPAHPIVANDNAPRWRLPLAASILFALGLGGGYLMRGEQQLDPASVNIAGLMDSELKSALETVPSGAETTVSGGKFRAIASFRDNNSSLCREFEKDRGTDLSFVGVACHTNGAWSVNTVIASAQTGDGYAPASSLDAIDAFIASIGAGEMLTAAEEQAALKAIAGAE